MGSEVPSSFPNFFPILKLTYIYGKLLGNIKKGGRRKQPYYPEIPLLTSSLPPFFLCTF